MNRKPLNVGKYSHYDRCRFCYGNHLHKIIDFGLVPLAGGFFPKNANKHSFESESYYPLVIFFCSDCYLLQSTNIISPKQLFKKYFYYSSSMTTLVKHFEEYALELKQIYKNTKHIKVLEIGCNDGIFLKPLIKEGFKVFGIDPAENIVRPLKKAGFKIFNLFFGEKTAKIIKNKVGEIDVITSTSSLAHTDDMHDILNGVKILLKPDGIFIMEEHYLGSLISGIQYDMMYHEHPSYYSLLSLKNFLAKFGMEIYKVKYSPLRAGLMRYYIKYNDNKKFKTDTTVAALLKKEKLQGLDKLSTFKRFYKHVYESKKHLLDVLSNLRKKGKTVIGYGASGRATIVTSYCRLTSKYLDYIVDDAPQKHGAYTPYNHLKVYTSEILKDKTKHPDYALLFAWPFWKEIKEKQKEYLKNGGKFIIPLPKVKIIGA